MATLVGDSFGDLSRLTMAQDQQRQAGIENAMGRLMATLQNLGAQRQNMQLRQDRLSELADANAYRDRALAANLAQFQTARGDRLNAQQMDEDYRRDALNQQGELGRMQAQLYNKQTADAMTAQQNQARDNLFRQLFEMERGGVDSDPAVLAQLTPEQQAQIGSLRSAANTLASDTAKRLNASALATTAIERGQLGELLRAGAPRSWFSFDSTDDAAYAENLRKATEALRNRKATDATTMFQKTRGLESLVAFDPAAGTFVPKVRSPLATMTQAQQPAPPVSVPPVSVPVQPTPPPPPMALPPPNPGAVSNWGVPNPVQNGMVLIQGVPVPLELANQAAEAVQQVIARNGSPEEQRAVAMAILQPARTAPQLQGPLSWLRSGNGPMLPIVGVR